MPDQDPLDKIWKSEREAKPDEGTYYDSVPGDESNYELEATFQYTNGVLAISQTGNDGTTSVLLSVAQVQALIDFYQSQEKRAKKKRGAKR